MEIGLNHFHKILLGAMITISSFVTKAQEVEVVEPWLINPTDFFESVPESEKYFVLPFNGVQTYILTTLESQYLGTPYRYGGTSKAGLDCSGFIQKYGAAVGVELPHSSKMIAEFGEEISLDEIQQGDLLFFTGRNKNQPIVGHVGVVYAIEGSAIKMIHAAVTGGVRIDEPFSVDYYKARFLFAKRLAL